MRSKTALAIVAVLGSGLLAYAAVGNGDIRPVDGVTVITITSPTGSGSGTATLQNTTANTTYNVAIGADATCDPAISFSVPGGNPITGFAPQTSRNVNITCPPRGSDAMRRCLLHAENSINGAPLADFMGVCLYGSGAPSLTPLQTSLDFGTVSVGDFAQQTLTIRNDALDQTITRVYLQTTDLDGNFQLAAPCNPDGTYCDEELATGVAPGGSFSIGIKCKPQAAGTHTAQVLVGTSSFQLLSLGVTLQCIGAATTAPALAIYPTTIAIPAPVDVSGDTASVAVQLENAGGSTLVITDVRTVDVDPGAADEWGYLASGKCTGQITNMCSLGAGDRVAINLTFDPVAIGRRRAALLVSYREAIDRTVEIPLEAIGHGATLRTDDSPLIFGSVPVGRTSQLAVELVNDGNRDASVMLSLAPTTTPPFTLSPATSTTVTPGMPRTVMVTCAPTAEGSFTTTVTAQGTDTVAMSALSIDAACDGITGELYANPTAVRLGEVRIGAGTIVRTVQLLSTDAGSPLTLTGPPVLASPSSSITLGQPSSMTTPATFDVTFTPDTMGPLSATILVSTSTGETLSIPLQVTVVRASYITSSTLELGTFCVDQPTTSSNAALVSDGTATIELLSPVLAQSPSPFELVQTDPAVYPHRLSGGGSVVVAITPKRQQTATVVSDTLTWRTDVAAEPTATTDLSARFIDSGGAIAPPALAFGEVTVHLFADNGQRVVIQNCNPTPLVLDPPMIRTPFSIDGPSLPSMLEPNESIAFSVGFHPTRVGPVSETLRITSPQLPGAPLEVMLTGIGGDGGFMPPDAGVGSASFEETTFYPCACSSSRPLGGLPIALSILCIVWRRRR